MIWVPKARFAGVITRLSDTFVLKDIEQKHEKRVKLIKGLDGYEKFLYFESGVYSWPKQNKTVLDNKL